MDPVSYVDLARMELRGEFQARGLTVEDELLDLYVMIMLQPEGAIGPLGAEMREHVHNAWALWRRRTNPQHPNLVPYSELDPDVQEMDRPYAESIRTARTRMSDRSRSRTLER